MTIKMIDTQEQLVLRFTVEEDLDFPGVLVLAKNVHAALPQAVLEKMMYDKYTEWQRARTPAEPVDFKTQELAQIDAARVALDAREAELKA